MKPHPLAEQSLDFAVDVVRLCDNIDRHAVLKNQLLRSATSIGANIHEGVYAASGADFIAKYHPKKIFVDHFDDAFPPLTREVSVERLRRTVKKNHPDIEFIVPEICKAVEL